MAAESLLALVEATWQLRNPLERNVLQGVHARTVPIVTIGWLRRSGAP